jgi:hypothetical protein
VHEFGKTYNLNLNIKLYLSNTLAYQDCIFDGYKQNLCLDEISGSHGGENEDDCLLGCCAVLSGRSLPTLPR